MIKSSPRYRQYPDYKDFGVEWLGKIPAHWKIRKLKYLGRFIGGGTPAKGETNYWKGDIPWVSPKDMYTSLVTDTLDHITEDAVKESATSVVPASSVLIVVRSGILRHTIPVAIAGRNVALNQDMKAFVSKRRALSWYLRYLIEGKQKDLLVIWRKEGATVESVDFDRLCRTSVPLPAEEEQQAIVDFLDRETAKIDVLIEKKERLIELLKEKRTALISHAVTKGLPAAAAAQAGLDPNVPMKDSGIEWLGQIPSHWALKRLKHILVEPLKYGANEAAELDDPELPRYVRITDIDDSDGLRAETFRSLPRGVAEPYILREGDLLLARSGATAGKTFLYRASWGECAYAGYLIRARVNQEEVLPLFVRYYTSSSPYWQWLSSAFIQATIQNVSAEKYSELFIPIPSLDEQRAIADFLDHETAKIDALIEKIEKAIKLLKEYRTALISAAVTGKIDVREEIGQSIGER